MRRKEVRKEITSVKSLFAPIIHLIELKRQDMVLGVKAAGSFQKWIESGGGAAALEEEERECAEKDLETDNQMNVWRAFADKEDQDRWHRAAGYSGTFFQSQQQ